MAILESNKDSVSDANAAFFADLAAEGGEWVDLDGDPFSISEMVDLNVCIEDDDAMAIIEAVAIADVLLSDVCSPVACDIAAVLDDSGVEVLTGAVAERAIRRQADAGTMENFWDVIGDVGPEESLENIDGDEMLQALEVYRAMMACNSRKGWIARSLGVDPEDTMM